jgi:polyphosphate kinase
LENRVEVLGPVEDKELRDQLRYLLDIQLNDRRGAWDMRPDGSYVQRMPGDGDDERHSQQVLAEWSADRYRRATRLRRRKPRGISRLRNVR